MVIFVYLHLPTRFIKFSRNGNSVLLADETGPFEIWDLETGEEIHAGRSGQNIKAAAISADGALYAFGRSRGEVKVFAVGKRRYLRKFELQHKDGASAILGIEFSRDSTQLLCTRGNYGLLVDLESGEVVEGPYNPEHRRVRCLLSPDRSKVAQTAMDYRQIWIWDADSGEEIMALEGHQGDVTDLVWLNDQTLVSSDNRQGLIRWDLPQVKPTTRFPLGLMAGELTNHGSRVATARNRSLSIIDMEQDLLVERWDQIDDHHWSIAYGPSGRLHVYRNDRANSRFEWTGLEGHYSPVELDLIAESQQVEPEQDIDWTEIDIDSAEGLRLHLIQAIKDHDCGPKAFDQGTPGYVAWSYMWLNYPTEGHYAYFAGTNQKHRIPSKEDRVRIKEGDEDAIHHWFTEWVSSDVDFDVELGAAMDILADRQDTLLRKWLAEVLPTYSPEDLIDEHPKILSLEGEGWNMLIRFMADIYDRLPDLIGEEEAKRIIEAREWGSRFKLIKGATRLVLMPNEYGEDLVFMLGLLSKLGPESFPYHDPKFPALSWSS